jgi:hypothetical protein
MRTFGGMIEPPGLGTNCPPIETELTRDLGLVWLAARTQLNPVERIWVGRLEQPSARHVQGGY